MAKKRARENGGKKKGGKKPEEEEKVKRAQKGFIDIPRISQLILVDYEDL